MGFPSQFELEVPPEIKPISARSISSSCDRVTPATEGKKPSDLHVYRNQFRQSQKRAHPDSGVSTSGGGAYLRQRFPLIRMSDATLPKSFCPSEEQPGGQQQGLPDQQHDQGQ